MRRNFLKLSKKEENVIECFLNGQSLEEIALTSSVSKKTIKNYFMKAKRRLECNSDHALKNIYELYKKSQETK